MIADSVMDYAYVGWKVGRTGGTVGVMEEQRAVNTDEPAAVHGPVYNIIMFLRRRHVIYILAVVFTSYSFPHTDELLGLGVYTIWTGFLYYM